MTRLSLSERYFALITQRKFPHNADCELIIPSFSLTQVFATLGKVNVQISFWPYWSRHPMKVIDFADVIVCCLQYETWHFHSHYRMLRLRQEIMLNWVLNFMWVFSVGGFSFPFESFASDANCAHKIGKMHKGILFYSQPGCVTAIFTVHNWLTEDNDMTEFSWKSSWVQS